MATRSLRALTFLAPNRLTIYRYVIEYLSAKLGLSITLTAGTDYAQVHDADLSFICGLAYVLRSPPRGSTAIEAVAATVLSGDRYGGRGVRLAVASVNDVLGPGVAGLDAADQAGLDAALRALDGTTDLGRLGAHAPPPAPRSHA